MIRILALLALSMFGVLAQNPKLIDICELFREPARWNGVMIQVRAPIDLGFGEGGPWLSGRHCPNRVEVKGIKFASLIALQDPQDRRFRLHAVDFHWDEGALDQFLALQHGLDRKTKHIHTTVVGMFETRTPLGDLIRPDRPNQYNGFGDQNAAPAQLLLKTMMDMTIEKNDQ